MDFVTKINGRDIVISLVLGDITKDSSDAIVNAAHEALMGGGGVDGAIHRAAGERLISECRELPKDSSGVRCKVGHAHMTGGYNLAARYVIHTVAPKFIGSIVSGVYKSVKNGTDKDMENCYYNCIDLAEKNGIKSMAFPSLGTGGHSYPIELACPIAIKTALDALSRTNSIEKITFVCFSQGDFDTYRTTMCAAMEKLWK